MNRITNITGILATFLSLAAIASFASEVPATQPVAQLPATRPIVGGSIRGIVTVNGDFDLRKPDLTRVVVHLDSDPALNSVIPIVGHATIAQYKKAFVPNFAVVAQGTTIEFPNWDDFEHNVFSVSKAAPAFDLDRYPKGQSKSRVFSKVGIVQLFCNIHPFMRAIVVVVPNGFFARADAEGKFEIGNIPPGKYKLVAWQERCDEQSRDVTVGPAGTISEATIQLDERAHGVVASEAPPADQNYGGVTGGMGVKREKLNLPVVTDVHPAPDAPPAQ